jgi:hypothetical protein
MPGKTDEDRIQSEGREANDAKPLNRLGGGEGGPERYPPARSDDAVEPKSFEPKGWNQVAQGKARDKSGAQGSSGEPDTPS